MDKKKEENYVEYYSIILIIAGFVIFFVGIALGNQYPIQTLKEAYENTTLTLSSYMYDTQFNWIIMCSVWGSGALLIFFFNILKDILNELRKANNTFTNKLK